MVTSTARFREFPVLLEVVFLFYTLISFVRVVTYARAQQRAGQLVGGAAAPPAFSIDGRLGWLFAATVMLLLWAQSPLYMIVVTLGLTSFLVQMRRTANAQFGLDRLSAGRLVKWSLFACGAVVFLELPLSPMIDFVMTQIHLPHPEQQSVEDFRQYNDPVQILAFLVQAVVFSPLIEELFFRGFLLTFLKRYTSTWLALVLSAGVFAFAHANLGAALPLWLLGLVLGVAYEHTGSLLLPIGIHACWNFLTALSLLVDRGGS